VVIAIIAILAAILFPVFAKAREKARQTGCLSNMKQIALGVMMYAQDYHECLAPWYYDIAGVWTYYPKFYAPYIKNDQVWACPSRGAYSAPSYVMGANPHYGYFCRLAEATRAQPAGPCPNRTDHQLASMDKPAEMVVMAESCAYDWPPTPGAGTDMGSARVSMSTWLSGGNGYYNAFPHNGGRNIVLADGHAKWYKRYGDTAIRLSASTNEGAVIVDAWRVPFRCGAQIPGRSALLLLARISCVPFSRPMAQIGSGRCVIIADWL